MNSGIIKLLINTLGFGVVLLVINFIFIIDLNLIHLHTLYELSIGRET